MALRDRRKSCCHIWSRNAVYANVSDKTLPSSPKNKGREEGGMFRLAGFCCYNFTIKLVIADMNLVC